MFNILFEQKEYEEVIGSEDFFSKMIFKNQNFFDFEKEFLFLMNISASEFQIFTPQKNLHAVETIFGILARTYEIDAQVEIKTGLRFLNVRFSALTVKKKEHRIFYPKIRHDN